MLLRTVSIILLIFIGACSAPDVITKEWKYVDTVVKGHPEVDHRYLLFEGHYLHAAIYGDIYKPALVIIHGTPGDWRQYARYLLDERLLTDYRVVVIDRPGWGESYLANDIKIASFALQARIISQLLGELKQESQGQPVVIMGHSLGASLAPKIAIDYPDLVDGLLLFAGALDPRLASPRWYNYLANIFPVNVIIGKHLQQANQEIFDLSTNIKNMADNWELLRTQVIAVQGMQDKLVSPENSFYIEKVFNAKLTKVIRLPEAGHLFPMTLRQEVVLWAREVLHRINRS